VSEARGHRKQNKEQITSDPVLMQRFSHFRSSLPTIALKRSCCYKKTKHSKIYFTYLASKNKGGTISKIALETVEIARSNNIILAL